MWKWHFSKPGEAQGNNSPSLGGISLRGAGSHNSSIHSVSLRWRIGPMFVDRLHI